MIWGKEFSLAVLAMLDEPSYWRPVREGKFRSLLHESGLVVVNHVGVIGARVVHSDDWTMQMAHEAFRLAIIDKWTEADNEGDRRRAEEINGTLISELMERYPRLRADMTRLRAYAVEATQGQSEDDEEDDDR